MSRIYENGYRIEYPDALAYAGMPAIVRVSNLDASYLGVGLTIQVGEAYYTETRTPYNGEVVFDISRYMQLAFVGRNMGVSYGGHREDYAMLSPTQQILNTVVVLTSSSGETDSIFDFDMNALYGHLSIGRANGAILRTRRWFVNYPQTFDFYAENPRIEITMPSEGTEGYSPTTEGIQQISFEMPNSLRASANEYSENKEALLYTDGSASFICEGKLVEGVEITYKLIVDKCKRGVYLRWLDNTGQWCYYLFRVTGRTYTTIEEQSWQDGTLRSDLEAVNDVYMPSTLAHQQLSQAESISLGAKLVDAETYDFLLSLTSSPIVEVLLNAEEYQNDSTGDFGDSVIPLWERVSIVAGSYARTSAPLQDFIVSIARAAHKSQML